MKAYRAFEGFLECRLALKVQRVDIFANLVRFGFEMVVDGPIGWSMTRNGNLNN